jgi:hypothetical protein
MSSSQIHYFLTLRNQIKLYHWSTGSYARHKATDEAVARLDEHIDKYVEVYLGKKGSRPRLTGDDACIRLTNMTEAGAVFAGSSYTKFRCHRHGSRHYT